MRHFELKVPFPILGQGWPLLIELLTIKVAESDYAQSEYARMQHTIELTVHSLD